MAGEPAVDDQRQRTLKALERRFAAEHDLQQKTAKRRLKSDESGKKPHIASPAAADSSEKLPKSSAEATPSKKGAFTFSGYVNSQDIDESGPTYDKLSHCVHENLLTASVEASGVKESRVGEVLHKLLQSGDSAQKYLQGSRSKRIDNWILLDNYVQGRGFSTGSRARALKIHSKRSKKRMSMKQQKKNGLLNLPDDFHSFDKFKPMHEMWKGYIVQLLKTTGKNQVAQCLLNADLHGAIIAVADCKIASYIGVSGIMIRETAETFCIIMHDDKFRVVPKKFSVFIFEVDCWKITLHGDKLTSRNLSL